EMPAALKNGSVDAVAIWEPHAQNALETVGGDAVVFENPAAYTERFNLNTRTDVLSDSARRAALARFLQAIRVASVRLRSRPAEVLPSLATRVGVTERLALAVWRQFKFPADLPKELRPSVERIEPWIAATQNRPARSRQELASLID